MADLKVNLSKTINAPIERVFDAWLDADMLAKFILPMPGMPEPRTEASGYQGGNFVIYMKVGDQEIPHKGQYLEVDRPNKLSFTWESPFSTDGSTVTINFSSLADNATYVDFEHVKFKDEEARTNHEGGWGNILDNLDEVLCVSNSQQQAFA